MHITFLISIFAIILISIFVATYHDNNCYERFVRPSIRLPKIELAKTRWLQSKRPEKVVYKDNVHLISGSPTRDYKVNKDSIILYDKSDRFKPTDVILGEEAPGFMREITNISYDSRSNTTLLSTKNVDISKVVSELEIGRDESPIYTNTNKEGFSGSSSF